MKNEFMLEIKELLLDENLVETVLYYYDRGLKYNFAQDLSYHKFIVGLNEYGNLIEIVQKIELLAEVVIKKIYENILENEIFYTHYKVLFNNGKSIDIQFVQNENIFSLIRKNGKYEVLKDLNEIIGEDDYEREEFWQFPNEYDFREDCIDFFYKLGEISVFYQDRDFVKSNLIFNDIIDELINILNIYLNLKYENKVYVDIYASNFKTYLDNEYYDVFYEILFLDRKSDLWTAIFKSARLYRKVAMQISDMANYEYTKEEDVKMMKYLRQIYSEEK